MKKGRYILVHLDKKIYRFNWLKQAKCYAISNCHGTGDFYIIVDTKKDEVVCKWYY